MRRFHWQLFALSTLSLSVSIENFGFTVPTPFFFSTNVFLNSKMSKMHDNHSRVAVDLEKILKCDSAESKTTLFFFCLRKKFFGQVRMTFGLVDVTYSLPEGQAVKLTFFAPWYLKFDSQNGHNLFFP